MCRISRITEVYLCRQNGPRIIPTLPLNFNALKFVRNNALLILVTPYVNDEDHRCYDDPTGKCTGSASVLRPIEDAVPEEQGPKYLSCPVDECVETTRANIEKRGVVIVLL